MERQFVFKIKNLREYILEMGGLVERAFEELRLAMATGDLERLQNATSYELKIDASHVQIDNLCLQMLAMQAPVASDLRLVMALVKINSDLERMGDQVVNIAYSFKDYLERTQRLELQELIKMAVQVQKMIGDSLNALAREDVDLAKKVLAADDAVDESKAAICEKLVEIIKADSNNTNPAIDLMLIARNIERMGDHATNVAENVIFARTGKDVRHGGALVSVDDGV
jgi:phosphate transport system protein